MEVSWTLALDVIPHIPTHDHHMIITWSSHDHHMTNHMTATWHTSISLEVWTRTSFSSHSQILFNSPGEKAQLQDKIWELPENAHIHQCLLCCVLSSCPIPHTAHCTAIYEETELSRWVGGGADCQKVLSCTVGDFDLSLPFFQEDVVRWLISRMPSPRRRSVH